ncbi:hypothetical protein ACT3SP_01085 [Brachybacterium sp. AOP43-C2-M15]|uniref:hypothetical protein n=1 Tax=Brachybacterium sp. AOP43-C2-M15 TaxID=3457661 RepID=UPI0040347645
MRPLVLRNGRAPVVAALALAAAVLAALLMVIQIPLERVPALLGLPAVLAAVAWVCYLRPRVVLAPEALTIVGIARTTTIPFSRIDRLDVRLGLTVHAEDGRAHGVWALPSAGRRVRRDERRRLHVERHVPASVQTVVDALARWRQETPRPSGSGERGESGGKAPIRSAISIVPPGLLVLAGVWALWGLRTAAEL